MIPDTINNKTKLHLGCGHDIKPGWINHDLLDLPGVDIVHDLNELGLDGKMIRAIIVLSQMNLHIWHNETEYRKGEGDGNLGLTHGLNGIRNTAKNIIQDQLDGDERKDYKVDCIAAEFDDWEVSW